MNTLLRRNQRKLHLCLRGQPVAPAHMEPSLRQSRFYTAYGLVRAFYLLLFYDAFQMLQLAHSWVLEGRVADPLWVLGWLAAFSFEELARGLGLGYVVCTLWTLAVPDRKLPRVLTAAFALHVYALENSFGALAHHHYFPLWLALIFAFLPAGQHHCIARSRTRREVYLTTFFLAQVAIAVFYTLSGFFKLEAAFRPGANIISNLLPDALPHIVIGRWLETGEHVFFERLFTANLWFAWPVFISVLYLEFFALVAVFRPQLHYYWGLALAILHIGIWLFMGISFAYQPVLVALLFVCSPFRPNRPVGIREFVLQSPLTGDLLRSYKAMVRRQR